MYIEKLSQDHLILISDALDLRLLISKDSAMDDFQLIRVAEIKQRLSNQYDRLTQLMKSYIIGCLHDMVSLNTLTKKDVQSMEQNNPDKYNQLLLVIELINLLLLKKDKPITLARFK